MPDLRKIRINIRNLVETVLAEGSLSELSPAVISAVEGIKVHQHYQNRGIKGYEAEVELSDSFRTDNVELLVSGKADGIYTDKSGCIHIEEIKTIKMDPELMETEGLRVHWAQVFMYGWFYCRGNSINEAVIDLVYFSRKIKTERIFTRIMTCAELEEFCLPIVEYYLEWQDRLEVRRKGICTSLEKLEFPFENFREGQRNFSKAVYRGIRDKKITFIEAPTGTGKTMAVIFPALKILGEGNAEKIFFLTAKNSGSDAAGKAIDLINESGAGVSRVTITAKAKICFMLDSEKGRLIPPCSPETCEYARDYFSKIHDALNIIFNENAFSRNRIEQAAKKYKVCPFELSLDIALFSEVVIADYNYAFDYGASLKRFFRQGKRNYVLLVDEAHNLVTRARDMFSGLVKKSEILKVRRGASGDTVKILGGLNKYLLSLKKQFPDGSELALADFPEGLDKKITLALDKLEDLIDRGHRLDGKALYLYWDLFSTRQVLDNYDDSYRTLIRTTKSDLLIELCCIDPSKQLQTVLKQNRAAVFFSGTLQPWDYFSSLISPALEPQFFRLESPFPSGNCLHIVNHKISTRWKDRDAQLSEYTRIVRELISAKNGNMIIFSPSFLFQNRLLDSPGIMDEESSGSEFMVQEPGMIEAERNKFLQNFEKGENVRGFCVIGGSFAESIDLIGGKLTGVVIFGVGIPQVNLYTRTIREYFNSLNGEGYNYSFLYPGINKVLQAAGRVIRSDTDRGFIYLIDDRYAQPGYKKLLPDYWNLIYESDVHSSMEKIRKLLDGAG